MSRKIIRGAAAAVAVIAVNAAAVTIAPAADAAMITVCDGYAEGATVSGNLVVPEGKACDLTKVTVKGSVTVKKDASLWAIDSNFEGDLKNYSYASVYYSKLGGDFVNDSPVKGVSATLRLNIGGDVISTGSGGINMAQSAVAGSINMTDSYRLRVGYSVVEKGITVSGSTAETSVCGSEVYGPATFNENAAGVVLGDAESDESDCYRDANYFGDDVTINNTGERTQLVSNIFAGNLSGTGNDPAPYGEKNRVRGEATSDFADIQPLPETETTSQQEATSRQQDEAEVKQRDEATKEQAAEAGKAF